MKRFLLFAFVVVAVFSSATDAWAQSITFAHGEKSNKKNYQPSSIRLEKGTKDGTYLSLEPEVGAMGRYKSVLVREVDINYTEHRRLKIDQSEGMEVYHSFVVGGQLHLVLSNLIQMRHVHVDLATFKVVRDSLLFDIEFDMNTSWFWWADVSDNNEYFGAAYAIINNKSNTAEVKAMLFDKTMRRLWCRDIDAGMVSGIMATNDGRIVTGGISNAEEKEGGATIEFGIVDANGARFGRHHSPNKLEELSLFNCYGDKVLASALGTANGTGFVGIFLSGYKRTHGTVYSSCNTYLFDVAKGTMAGSDRHEFDKDDMLTFYNAAKKAEKSSPDINFLCERAKVTTTDGAAIVYGRVWKEIKRDMKTGMTSELYKMQGLMLFSIDSLGKINWRRSFMHDNGMGGTQERCTETDLVYHNGKLYLLTNEDSKESDTYTPGTPASRVGLITNGGIAAYIVTANGDVSKQMVERKGINIITTRLQDQGNGLYYFISSAQKGHLSEIKIND